MFKIVKMIMERNFQPVIIFSFSKKDCEAYALQMTKLDFNTGTVAFSVVSVLFKYGCKCVPDKMLRLVFCEGLQFTYSYSSRYLSHL